MDCLDYTDNTEIPTADPSSPESPLPQPDEMMSEPDPEEAANPEAIPEKEAAAKEGETETEVSEEDGDCETEDSGEDNDSDSDELCETARIIFERCYTCRPLSGKEHLEQGGQIVMPESALVELMDKDVSYPMLFGIRNESESDSKASHCGVAEFTAEEGTVMVPKWMMKNLNVEAGKRVKLIKNVEALEKCTYTKLQPHSVEFWAIRDMKTALEQILSANFFCLTSGDTLLLEYQSRKFYVDVVETKPAPAVCILDTDFKVDFATPLDYVEPKKVEEKEQGRVREAGVFVPFSGVGRRLNGTAAVESAMVVEEKAAVVREEVKQFQPFTGKKYTLAG